MQIRFARSFMTTYSAAIPVQKLIQRECERKYSGWLVSGLCGFIHSLARVSQFTCWPTEYSVDYVHALLEDSTLPPFDVSFRWYKMLICSWASSLFIPPRLAGLSVTYLGIKFRTACSRAVTSVSNRKLSASKDRDVLSSKKRSTLSETVKEFDGCSIISFRILRFLVVAALLAVQVVNVTFEGRQLSQWFTAVISRKIEELFYYFARHWCFWIRYTHRHSACSLFSQGGGA